MSSPLVTILMPVYNAEKYLAEAIESMLHQTFKNFEFLIINDASTDNSADIIRSYTDPRIRLVENEINLGISATLNKGIELASAELIARMDADDISYPERLEKQYQYFQRHPDCALLSTAAREVTEEKELITIEQFNPDHFYYILNFECWIYHSTVMYKRSAVIAAGGYSLKYSEDYDLWWKLSRNHKIAHLPDVLLDYRHSQDSLCKVSKADEYFEGHHELIKRNVEYYVGNHIDLTAVEAECLRYNCQPLLEENNVNQIAELFIKLDYINDRIFEKENVNRNIQKDKEAAAFKKELILNWFLQRLPLKKQLILLKETGYATKIIRTLLNKLRSYPAKIFSPKFSVQP